MRKDKFRRSDIKKMLDEWNGSPEMEESRNSGRITGEEPKSGEEEQISHRNRNNRNAMDDHNKDEQEH